jgi:hypothetical protein
MTSPLGFNLEDFAGLRQLLDAAHRSSSSRSLDINTKSGIPNLCDRVTGG